jgi:hypothetical protein
MSSIGYFYLYKRFLLGEVHLPETAPDYEGHYQFWVHEAPRFFLTEHIPVITGASYGCDRGRITLFEGSYRLMGTAGVIRNADKILQLFGVSDVTTVLLIADDSHYKIIPQDRRMLGQFDDCFKIPENYPYLIGRL